MNKICTSLEQSKKLIKLGIDVNTADMDYVPCVNDMNEYDYVVNIWNNEHEENWIPAWSLTALLEYINRNFYNISLNCCGAEYTISFDDNEIYKTITKDYSIDAAFEMVCWLKENNRI